jgi:hypothetical protein
MNLEIVFLYLFKDILLLMFLETVLICLLKPALFFTASSEEVHLTPESSPELTKKSWFGSLMTTEKDETFTILVKGKPLATVKADLIHAFLSVSDMLYLLLHSAC